MKRPPFGPWGHRDPSTSQGDDHPEWGLPGERKSWAGCVAVGTLALLVWGGMIYAVGQMLGAW